MQSLDFVAATQRPVTGIGYQLTELGRASDSPRARECRIFSSTVPFASLVIGASGISTIVPMFSGDWPDIPGILFDRTLLALVYPPWKHERLFSQCLPELISRIFRSVFLFLRLRCPLPVLTFISVSTLSLFAIVFCGSTHRLINRSLSFNFGLTFLILRVDSISTCPTLINFYAVQTVI